ncbi:CLUMA_CG008552, isoform A [Clunio marinus]|uniref:CLUMA_CG008552, isoform A n=1 Tax=Clunio marinus TaxID=568069 RepID=A0A1J1I5Q3_9DIPT|nr:CLUMA_CG008552, isoform A [Clunio marinus]
MLQIVVTASKDLFAPLCYHLRFALQSSFDSMECGEMKWKKQKDII